MDLVFEVVESIFLFILILLEDDDIFVVIFETIDEDVEILNENVLCVLHTDDVVELYFI